MSKHLFGIVHVIPVSLSLLLLASTAANAQVERASDIFPLEAGKSVSYVVYPTDTSGTPNVSTASYATTDVLTSGQVFNGKRNVAVVADTARPSAVSNGSVANARYMSDDNGDIHAFADANFLALFVPNAVAGSLTPPDSFVNYLLLTYGIGTRYHVLNLSQDVTVQNIPVTIQVDAEGEFRGIERISVPAGKFDSAYRFTIHVKAIALSGSYKLMEINSEEDLWLVKSIGIVKTNTPTLVTALTTVQGTERQMVSYHSPTPTLGVARPRTPNTTALAVFPNPASREATLTIGESGAHPSIELYSLQGSLIRTIPASEFAGGSCTVDTHALVSGEYFFVARTTASTAGAPVFARFSVIH